MVDGQTVTADVTTRTETVLAHVRTLKSGSKLESRELEELMGNLDKISASNLTSILEFLPSDQLPQAWEVLSSKRDLTQRNVALAAGVFRSRRQPSIRGLVLEAERKAGSLVTPLSRPPVWVLKAS